MAKKQVSVSLRKPPPSDVEAFVQNKDAPKPATREIVRTAESQVVTTRAGDRREMVVYLPEDVARQLSIRCLEMDRDMSNVIAEAVRRDLEAPAKVAAAPLVLSDVVELAKERLETLWKTRPWTKLPFAFS